MLSCTIYRFGLPTPFVGTCSTTTATAAATAFVDDAVKSAVSLDAALHLH